MPATIPTNMPATIAISTTTKGLCSIVVSRSVPALATRSCALLAVSENFCRALSTASTLSGYDPLRKFGSEFSMTGVDPEGDVRNVYLHTLAAGVTGPERQRRTSNLSTPRELNWIGPIPYLPSAVAFARSESPAPQEPNRQTQSRLPNSRRAVWGRGRRLWRWSMPRLSIYEPRRG